LKILILYTYNKGLLSEFFQELSEKLYSDGFDVDNFYLKNKSVFFTQNGVSIYGEKRRGFFSNYKAIYNVIKHSQPDVVISNFSYINPAVLFGKLLGVKRNIAWFHTAFGHTKPNLLKVWNKTVYLYMADVVLANSKSLQREMHSVYKVSKEKIKRVPFWTNIVNYQNDTHALPIERSGDIINIGCPGRLVADKNHSLVIRAMHQLKQSREQLFHLYIAGSGIYEHQLQQLVKKLNLEQDVTFLGLLDVSAMTEFYKTMDVVVLPSLHEAFGLVFIETIALGTPVLVSNAFGALSFIDVEKFPLEDFCFNPESIQELINKLSLFIETKGLKSQYFKFMYEQTFEKEHIYNQIKSIILDQNGTT